jgi:hypothetical protein
VDDTDWGRLLRQLERGDCTPFLGAGACYGTLPTAAEMSRVWADKYHYPFEDHHDLPRVMQYISVIERDPISVKEGVCEDFSRHPPPPFEGATEPHSFLANFPIRVFITTNYDDFLVRALTRIGKKPVPIVCPWYLPATTNFDRFFSRVPIVRPDEGKPLVFHLHGSMGIPKSIVLAEDDYLEFLANIAVSRSGDGTDLIPSVVLSAMTDYPLLFVGYSLQDWTFRVLFHSLVRTQAEVNQRRSVSVQLLPPLNVSVEEAERRARDYIANYLGGWRISIFWGTAEDFFIELNRRMGQSV